MKQSTFASSSVWRRLATALIAPLIFMVLTVTTLVFAGSSHAIAPPELDSYITQWAQINYQQNGKQQKAAFEQLAEDLHALAEQYPDSAEVHTWKGITLSTYAGAKGGLGALSLVKEARVTLRRALAIQPDVLNGSAYTSLGALYYQVPGWPISFGDKGVAEQMLKQALKINPNGIDPNYFYADLLYQQKRYHEARQYAVKAIAAPRRPGLSVADNGRRQEAQALLARLEQRDE